MSPTAVVTGANSGIGLETARELARVGHRVFLVCRNPAKAAEAMDDIRASVPDADLELVLADLGLQADVRRAADQLAEHAPRIDLLVNNAGMTIRRPERTAEGVDTMLAVNHLGPFLLTTLLLPQLEAAAPSRIVTVASDAHKMGRPNLDDMEDPSSYGFLGFPRYGTTKLWNILFTRELARRLEGTGVVANCVHPGAVRTNIGDPPGWLRFLLKPFFLTPADGAKTTLAAALDPAYAEVSGRYFVKERIADDRLTDDARDDAVAAELWARTEALVGR